LKKKILHEEVNDELLGFPPQNEKCFMEKGIPSEMPFVF
jgi:hypothetical protein